MSALQVYYFATSPSLACYSCCLSLSLVSTLCILFFLSITLPLYAYYNTYFRGLLKSFPASASIQTIPDIIRPRITRLISFARYSCAIQPMRAFLTGKRSPALWYERKQLIN